MKYFFGSAIIISLALLFISCGIDNRGYDKPPPQTKILDVRVNPGTVAPKDTATFTCLIKDSTDSRFRYIWYVSEGKLLGVKYLQDYNAYQSENNRVKWIATDKKGTYLFDVYAYNGTSDSTSVDMKFKITVK